MIRHIFKTSFFLLFCWCLPTFSADQLKTHPDNYLNPPLFISLGSHCEPSQHLILNNLRSAAFPFDWLLTLNFQGFLSLIEEDFKFFMDQQYLTQDDNKVVINTYYCIDFRHELHDWPDNDFFKHYTEIKEKYRRRINRFKECKYNKSKVFFIRTAFDLNLNPHLPTITPDCTKIDKNQANALKDVLCRKFPKLDFYLVIINYAEENADDILGLDRVLEFKIRKSHKKEDYANLFLLLIELARKS